MPSSRYPLPPLRLALHYLPYLPYLHYLHYLPYLHYLCSAILSSPCMALHHSLWGYKPLDRNTLESSPHQQLLSFPQNMFISTISVVLYLSHD